MGVIVTSTVLMGVLGLAFGVFLAYSAKKFHVEEDPRVELIVEILPGANCGMCGYPGCDAYARAIVKKGESVDRCVPGKPSGVAQKIKEILSKKSEELKKD